MGVAGRFSSTTRSGVLFLTMKQLLAALMLLFIGSAAHAAKPYVIIQNDPGGRLDLYARSASVLMRADVQIRGFCASACSLYLGNPRTCVHRDAVLYFHSAHGLDPNASLTKEVKQEQRWWNNYMMSTYPPKLRKWIRARGGLTKKWLTLKGKELKSVVRVCR